LAVSPVEVALAIDAVETANTIAIASTNNASLKNVFDRRDEMTLKDGQPFEPPVLPTFVESTFA